MQHILSFNMTLVREPTLISKGPINFIVHSSSFFIYIALGKMASLSVQQSEPISLNHILKPLCLSIGYWTTNSVIRAQHVVEISTNQPLYLNLSTQSIKFSPLLLYFTQVITSIYNGQHTSKLSIDIDYYTIIYGLKSHLYYLHLYMTIP